MLFNLWGSRLPTLTYALTLKPFKISSKNFISLFGLICLIAKSLFSKSTFALSLGKPFSCIFNKFSRWKARFLMFFASCNTMRDFCHLLKGLLSALSLSWLNSQYFLKERLSKNFSQKYQILFYNILLPLSKTQKFA